MNKNFNFKKKFGQNFLIDKDKTQRIVDLINANEDDLIIEIGPGAGALTKRLVKKNAKLICYEIDEDTKEYLLPLENDKTKIVYKDFLTANVKEVIKDIEYKNLYIVGNLPYYITTPIIEKIIKEEVNVKKMVFMVQKEVGERFASKPNTREYGSITVFLNYYFNIKQEFIVGRKCFNPSPNVDSVVISLNQKAERKQVDMKKFDKLVRDSFQFKRKNLRNNLKKYDLDKVNEILSDYKLDITHRAEELDYTIFVDLCNRLF
jgi:16S rRNA (adenine1518-N6/adenine1519-N6)-dimethyltransferase